MSTGLRAVQVCMSMRREALTREELAVGDRQLRCAAARAVLDVVLQLLDVVHRVLAARRLLHREDEGLVALPAALVLDDLNDLVDALVEEPAGEQGG